MYVTLDRNVFEEPDMQCTTEIAPNPPVKSDVRLMYMTNFMRFATPELPAIVLFFTFSKLKLEKK